MRDETCRQGRDDIRDGHETERRAERMRGLLRAVRFRAREDKMGL